MKNTQKRKSYLFCDAWKDGCISELFSIRHNLDLILNKHTTLIKRYYEFIELNDFDTLTVPYESEPFPPYHYLAKVNRLVLLDAINLSKNGDINKAIEKVKENILSWRKLITSADNLIAKAVCINILAENIDILSVLIRNNSSLTDLKLDPLTKSELDFAPAMSRELAYFYYLFENIYMDSDTSEERDLLAQYITRALMKPNMSTNIIYSNYKYAAHTSLVSPKEFSKIIESADNSVYNVPISIRNLGGAFTLIYGKPYFYRYVGRIHDLNIKIKLFNKLIDINSPDVEHQEIENPYFFDNRTTNISENKKWVCFDGPLEDERMVRCLRLGL